MIKYDSFCHDIDNGLFDEPQGAEWVGPQRLITATDPFVIDGQLTKKQQKQLFWRLHERRLKKSGDQSGGAAS
jgi:hypothetical protein